MTKWIKCIKNLLNEALIQSKIHGVPNIGQNKFLPVKILWSFFVLTATVSCSFLIIESILEYLEYKVLTKINVVKETISIFPTISICNSYPFMTVNASIYLKKILNEYNFNQILNYTDYNEQIEPTKGVIQYFTGINSGIVPTEMKKSFGLKLEQMLLSCLYRGSICLASDFEWYYDLIYGNCYRFNSGLNKTLKTATTIGKLNGLRLELFVGSTNDVEISLPSTGVHIFIHNNTDKPNSYEGIDVPTGKETNVGLSRTFSKKLKAPYSNCISESNYFFYQKLVELNGKYRYRDCILYCLQEILIKNCDCQDGTSQIINASIRICSSGHDYFGCVYPVYTSFLSGNISETCSFCLYECDNLFFEHSSSFNSYPSKSYANFLFRLKNIQTNKITDFERLRRKVLSLNIFYETLKYKVIEEVPCTDLFTLLSLIGGTMGLFLGMSFINFFEIVELIMRVFFLVKTNFKN